MTGLLKKLTTVFLLLLILTAKAVDFLGIPCQTDQLISRKNLVIGYSHKYRQALWVAYQLNANNLRSKQVRRRDKFMVDPLVKVKPIRPKDYNRSGYDKGHLAPAADMTYSWETMRNSFFMTNISPQIPGCNRGIWKRIENQVRQWALQEETLIVITGPIFPAKPKLMGKAKIPVPEAFFKIVLDTTAPMKMIAFIVPNKTSKRRIASFAVSVDKVEELTGFDFFYDLDSELEEFLESNSVIW